ncbi:hypothetical protein [Variovorax saccharolyticus]|nr:hypothetical protein [Variovorax sp. J31P216]MDM0026340.1 hypothetical protein [Variovorax sp. J31P216]
MAAILAVVLSFLAWREHASANRRDAGLLASIAALTGVGALLALI